MTRLPIGVIKSLISNSKNATQLKKRGGRNRRRNAAMTKLLPIGAMILLISNSKSVMPLKMKRNKHVCGPNAAMMNWQPKQVGVKTWKILSLHAMLPQKKIGPGKLANAALRMLLLHGAMITS